MADERTGVTDEDVVDGYLYLLARFIVLRQENLDINVEKVGYNTIKYNPLASATFVNPNIDVAYLEAWIAVDPDHSVVLNVPEVTGRYYTAQILDGWGEVIANLNERTHPEHPGGRFAFAIAGTNPRIPHDAVRVDLPAPKAKLLARVECKDDPNGAVTLQHQFTLDVPDGIEIAPAFAVPDFTNAALMGSEIFTLANGALATYPDSMPSAVRHQATVARVATTIASSDSEARRIADVVHTKAIPKFFEGAKGFGTHEGGWSVSYVAGRFGDDILARDIINFGGLWANSVEEAIYFVGLTDDDGTLLDGDGSYRIDFASDELPEHLVNRFWSMTLYSVPDYHLVPNALDRHNLNSTMNFEYNSDGGLTLWLDANKPPNAPETNWLPTPTGQGFALTLRLYVSKPAVLNGTWFPAPIKTT
jgi:hypothetical protein